MSPNEVAPWMLLVFFAVTLCAGLYLLLRGQQAASPGGDSVVTALGIKVSSPTPGVAVVVFSILGLIVTLTLGVLDPNGDDTEATSGDSSGSHSSTGTTTNTGNTGTNTPPPAELDDSNAIDTDDLEDATAGTIAISGWADAPGEERPVLDCQSAAVVDMSGHQAHAGEKKNFTVDGGATAHAMTTANLFDTAENAQAAYERIVAYLDNCPAGHPDSRLHDAPNLVANGQAGTRVSVQLDSGRAVARNFWTIPDTAVCPSPCVWLDSQAVGRVGNVVVLLSIDWFQPGGFVDETAPITRAMQLAMDRADD